MFEDRRDAGRRLLERLRARPEAGKDAVVAALPRGGVPLGEVIADGLGLPLDVVMVRKVGLPGHPETALAAVTDGAEPGLAVNESLARAMGYDRAAILRLAAPELEKIAARREDWRSASRPHSVAGRTVIVVDDGVATGATMRAALAALRVRGAARLIAAVPVAPPEALAALAEAADEVICLETPARFVAVGAHYRHFGQVPDAEVAAALKRRQAAGDGADAP